MTEYDRAILSFCATFLLLLLLLLFSLSPVLSVFEVVASGWGSGRNSGANRIAALLIALVPLACRFSTHLFIYDFRFIFHKLISFLGGSLPLSDFFNFFFFCNCCFYLSLATFSFGKAQFVIGFHHIIAQSMAFIWIWLCACASLAFLYVQICFVYWQFDG